MEIYTASKLLARKENRTVGLSQQVLDQCLICKIEGYHQATSNTGCYIREMELDLGKYCSQVVIQRA